MKKLCIIYNQMGMGSENAAWYLNCVQSLLRQTAFTKWPGDIKVAISGCCTTIGCKGAFEQDFRRNCSYNFIDANYPVSVTFNDTVNQMVKHFGPFEGYLYLDSGISFWDPSKNYTAIEKFYETFKSHNNAVTAAMPSNDDGHQWWGIKYEPNTDLAIPVGKATNLHCQIFPEEWRLAYNRILPDIFASNCMESVFAGMAAAIHKKYVMTQAIEVLHLTHLDGASIGSRRPDEDRFPMSKMFPIGGLLYKTTKDMDARFAEGYELGFGFEECSEFWKHDPEKFDQSGFAKDARLKEFMAKEMFLKEEEFSYNDIVRQFIPGS